MKTLLLILFALTACATPPPGLNNFHAVELGKLYRSAQPDAGGYASLAAQGIRTVVKLNTEGLAEEQANARHYGIKLFYIPLSGLLAPSEADEAKVQAILANPANQPVDVHCQWGKDRTGLAAALYRVHQQHWPAAQAHAEWMELGHSPLLFTMDNFFHSHSGK